jgi:hypothetical protein
MAQLPQSRHHVPAEQVQPHQPLTESHRPAIAVIAT